jgi:fucose permease
MLALVLVWGSLWLLLTAMLLFGTAMSLFDVAINTEGTALESLSGCTVMSNLNAMFSVGAMVGAAIAGALLRAQVDPRLQLAAIGVAPQSWSHWSRVGCCRCIPRPPKTRRSSTSPGRAACCWSSA